MRTWKINRMLTGFVNGNPQFQNRKINHFKPAEAKGYRLSMRNMDLPISFRVETRLAGHSNLFRAENHDSKDPRGLKAVNPFHPLTET